MAMKKELIWHLGSLILALVILGGPNLACGSKGSDNTMGPSPAPTVGPTPVVVTASGLSFSPSSLTIPSGTVVTFSGLAGHTVNIDDSAVGTCGNSDLTSFPANRTFTGPSGTDFKIHCDYHSPCGSANCAGACSGMAMNIHIL
jgi:plastocyanin